MSDSRETMEIKVARYMAWERAKGEMQSMLQTYFDNERYEAFRAEVEKFVEYVESEGLQE